MKTFEGDLEVLNHYGVKAVFDPISYPENIQPLWVKVSKLPDDAEEALNFWINDGSQEHRLTDSGPRGKWNWLMKARILNFELPQEWEEELIKFERKKQQKNKKTRFHSAICIWHRKRSVESEPHLCTLGARIPVSWPTWTGPAPLSPCTFPSPFVL